MYKEPILLVAVFLIALIVCGAAAAATNDDLLPPRVKHINPVNNSTDVPATKLIKITFSKPVHSPNASLIRLETYSDKVKVPITYTIVGNTMYIDHVPLKNQRTYLLTFKPNFVKDKTGVGSSTNRSFRFKTGTISLRAFKAKLVIPRIKGNINIRKDTCSAYNAVYHYSGSAYFGTPGQCALLGHRTTWSAPLRKIHTIKKGDLVYILDYTAKKKCTYRAQYYEILPNGKINNNFKKSGPSTLILKSCHPPGSGANKYIVYFNLVKTVAL